MSGPADYDLSERRSFWRNLSAVWLVPLLAIVVSLAVAWQAYSERGVAIEISFPNAAGVVEGETSIRFRDVVIGTVESVGFSEGLSRVLVEARIDKEVAQYLDEDAVFWVVRPEVSARGITGLNTVLSGVYIEGAWDAEAGGETREFEGLDTAPLTRPGREGTRITLRTEDARQISAGAPVLFRGIEVGVLEEPRLTISGNSIVVDAFIQAPHDRRLNMATRFWDASGFSVSLGTGGISLEVESLASLVSGGLAFDSIYEGGAPLGPGYVFEIYEDEATARRTAFTRTIADAVTVSVAFSESVDGLSPGADVRYGGLRVGEVDTLTAQVEEGASGPDVQLVAQLAIDPALLGLPADAGEAEVLDFLDEAVANGLRARLATESILSGQLVVDLAELEDAGPATFDRDAEPYPRLPSAPSNLPDFTATAEGVLERINALPIEEVLEQAVLTMRSFENLAADEGLRAAPDAAVALIEEARAFVADPETRAIPGEIRAAVESLREVVAGLEESQAVARLSSALAAADVAAQNLAAASEEVPALVAELRSVAEKANSLPAEDLVASATRLLDSADAVIGTDGARNLPPTLTAALDEIRTTLAALNDGDVVSNANATMASARDAADSIAAAAEGLPDLSARLESLVARGERLIGSYDGQSTFNSETLSVLREIKDAARAVSQLARALERNPNSLIIGR
jgi:paraquat-inducible protein B